MYEGEVLTWFALADVAAAAIREGRRPAPVPTRVIGQERLQPWARGVVWDCRDPMACVPVARSTRHTAFPGKRQLDRDAVRRVAALLDWHDGDIIDQIGEGGVEVRSDCTLDIVLTFHHDSLLQEMEMAEASVTAHTAEGWVEPPRRHLPFVPCRLQPRGVVMQPRTRLREDGVTLEEYDKPRITTDSSFGGVDSVNAGCSDEDRSVGLPSCQSLGRGWAICQSAFPTDAPATEGGGTRVRGYCVDAESAYSFCPVQHADLWTQCFCWWGPDGRTGTAVDLRMGFGGAFAPNRFVRTSTFVAAYAQHLQDQFDSEQPLPPCAQRFTAHRRARQATGLLPPGEGQCRPRYLQVFVDDFTGSAAADTVVPPPSVAHIQPAPDHMMAAGCAPAAAHTRVWVHAQLTVLALQRLGLHAAPHKIMCGSPLPALGLLVDGDESTIRCPAGKLRAVLADAAAQLERATTSGDVDRTRARRLVGRMQNLTQVAPDLRGSMHGGYAVTEASWPGSGGSRGAGTMHLRHGSPAHSGWVQLLRRAPEALAPNVGVQMAPSLTAPARDSPGCVTSVTDASGEDGFGGYAFSADRPGEVFVLSEPWGAWATAALAAAADPDQARARRDGDQPRPHLSMPAAELFAAIALPLAMARVTPLSTVFAVGDCSPAAGAIDALYSRTPQVRHLLEAAAASPWAWIGAKVPREANLDADRLSHPAQAADVRGEAARSGLAVHELKLLRSDWALLEEAISLTAGAGAKRRRTG